MGTSFKNPNNQNFEKLKKLLEISLFYTCVSRTSHMRYGSWDIEWGTIFFVILGHILPFYPPNNPENQTFEKIKKASGDVIILHMCTKNHDHMMYASWDMKCGRDSFLSFWAIFSPFTPLTTQKIKILKNEKNTWRHHFTHV